MRPTTLRVLTTRVSLNALIIVTATLGTSNDAGLPVESIACWAVATVFSLGANSSFATSCVMLNTGRSQKEPANAYSGVGRQLLVGALASRILRRGVASLTIRRPAAPAFLTCSILYQT